MADTAKFGVDISALYLFGWMPAKRAIKGGRTTLRFPSLALSRSGTKGISHPETTFQDP
jgi:hypothetical protein